MTELFTAQELETIRAYHQPHYVASAFNVFVWPVVMMLGVVVLTRPLHALAVRLTSRVRSPVLARVWGDDTWSAALAFALLYFGVFALLDLPFEVWFGFLREREFGMSSESFGSWLFDLAKGQLFLVLGVSALTFGVFGIARRSRHWWWWVGATAVVLMVGTSLVEPWRARLYVDQRSLEAGPLRTRLEALLAATKVEYSDIFVVDTSAKTVRVQAAFAGTGPTRTILLTDTLLASMTEEEITAAVAHEAGHISEARWPGRVLTALAVVLLLGLVEWAFRRSSQRHWFGIEARADVRMLPLLVLVFDLAVSLGAPFSAAVSRQRELEADRFALRHVSGTAMHSLLVKLARINKLDPTPPTWFVLAGMTHPPLLERLAAVQKNATPPPMTPVTDGTSEQHEPGVMR